MNGYRIKKLKKIPILYLSKTDTICHGQQMFSMKQLLSPRYFMIWDIHGNM